MKKITSIVQNNDSLSFSTKHDNLTTLLLIYYSTAIFIFDYIAVSPQFHSLLNHILLFIILYLCFYIRRKGLYVSFILIIAYIVVTYLNKQEMSLEIATHAAVYLFFALLFSRISHYIHQESSAITNEFAELSLKESIIEKNLKNYLNLFNQFDDLIWLLDEELNILHVNNEVKRLFHIDNVEIYKCKSTTFFNIEQGELESELSNSSIDAIVNPKIKLLLDDSEDWVTKISRTTWNNKPVYLIQAHNVGDYIESQNKLQEIENNFQKAFYGNPAMMCIYSYTEEKYIDVNESFSRITGYSRSEIIGKKIKDIGSIIESGNRDFYLDIILNNKHIENIEVNIHTKDGRDKTGIFFGEIISFQNLPCILMVVLDTTESKLLSNKLSEQSRILYGMSFASSKLLAAIDIDFGIPDAMVIIGRAMQCQILTCYIYNSTSNLMEQSYNWTNENTQYSDLVLNKISFSEDVLKHLTNGKTINNQDNFSSLTTADLTKIPNPSYFIAPISVENKLWGVMLFIYREPDKHWSKGDEVILLAFTAAISGAITKHIALKAMQQAKTDAEYANQAKSKFLAMISHDIRTPMNGILGMAALLQQSTLTTEQLDYVETIRLSGDTLLDLINDILDFSKIGSGKLELLKHSFNFESCLEDILEVLAIKAVENNNELYYDIKCPIDHEIIGDMARIRQILLNLIGNALKFTTNGLVYVQIDQVIENNRNYLIISVEDNGIGISPEQRDIIFQPFVQAESNITQKYGGTGLGLSITQHLVELMDGELTLESDLGKGSIFTVKIPVVFNDYEIIPHLTISELANTRCFINIKNELNRNKVISLLSEQNIQICECNTQDCLERHVNDRVEFSFGILESEDQDNDTLHCVKKIRSVPELTNIPLIVLCPIGKRDITLLLNTESSVYFYTKPIRNWHFLTYIKNIIKNNMKSNIVQTSDNNVFKHVKGSKPSILVAEDNHINQKIILEMLRKLNHSVTFALNGNDVISQVRTGNFDLIFMDIRMPYIDGLEATRQIRKMTDIHQPKIVAMTANAMEKDRIECLEAGMDDFISKPISFMEINRILVEFGF